MPRRLHLPLLLALAGMAIPVPRAASAERVDDVPAAEAASTHEPAPASMPSRHAGLAPDAFEALRRKVLVQCGLDVTTDRLPWYFHFEFGRALLEAGDARRAIVQLAQSVDLNPVPRADKRLYGMWFTDYLPYFQLADAHARLENWPCAAHALELSRVSGEAGSGRLDPQRVRAVEDAIESHADALGACRRDEVFDPRMASSF